MDRPKMEFVNLRQVRLGLAAACARLAAHHYEQGRRVLILAGDGAQAEELDRALWAFSPDSFVPHGQAGAPDQDQEPVLIATEAANLNQAQVLIMAHVLDDPPLTQFSHLIQFVPAQEGPELEASRSRYRALKEGGEVELIHSTKLG
jgi:DNA polymerase-3 subunit chi